MGLWCLGRDHVGFNTECCAFPRIERVGTSPRPLPTPIQSGLWLTMRPRSIYLLIFSRVFPSLSQESLIHERMPNLELVYRPSAYISIPVVFALAKASERLQLPPQIRKLDFDGTRRIDGLGRDGTTVHLFEETSVAIDRLHVALLVHDRPGDRFTRPHALPSNGSFSLNRFFRSSKSQHAAVVH